jgi:uncharacterized protein (TIGR00159 family)
MLDFVSISLVDILDIILVGLLIFQIIRLIRGTAAMSIFAGILLLYVIWLVVSAFNMKLLSSLMGQVLGVGVIALIVIFQPEIRRFLLHLGSRYASAKRGSFFRRFFKNRGGVNVVSPELLEELTEACRMMSQDHTGALIVLKHKTSLAAIVETGDEVDARVSRRLLLNIFFKNSPLHDGALIIANDRIQAVRCTLPVSANPNIPAQYGLRHRAAVGITEQSDASVIVVSEETGKISFVSNGVLKQMNSITELRTAIENSYR